jgi:hypothetical protein
MRRERLFVGVGKRESPRGCKAQESKRSRPGLILRGSAEGARLSLGDQAAEAPVPGRMGLAGKRESGVILRKRDEIPREEWKALKGEAQECWGLKETLKGWL